MNKPVLVSGLKSEGHLHIGNYLGALQNLVKLQNSGKYQCYFFIADLHSLTEDFDPKEKPAQISEAAAEYLAAGLDPGKSVIFLQSQVPAHSELLWLFSAIAPEGELRRMTQYKDKAVAKKQNVVVGLLTYPVLMAADILLYDANLVPVGQDQLQHLELTRTLARKFNSRFGVAFTEPQPLLSQLPKVTALDDPTKKMSKSHPHGCLYIDNSPEEIKKRIGRAVTDSGSEIKYDPSKKPGLSNLIGVYAALKNVDPKTLEKEFAGKSYAEFKSALADLISNYFSDFREKKRALTAQSSKLKAVLQEGSAKAAAVAEKKLAEVKRKIGIAV